MSSFQVVDSSPGSSVSVMETSNFAHVIFQNVGKSFLPQAPLECRYTLTPYITPHPKDWVGIFKVHHAHSGSFKDIVEHDQWKDWFLFIWIKDIFKDLSNYQLISSAFVTWIMCCAFLNWPKVFIWHINTYIMPAHEWLISSLHAWNVTTSFGVVALHEEGGRVNMVGWLKLVLLGGKHLVLLMNHSDSY